MIILNDKLDKRLDVVWYRLRCVALRDSNGSQVAVDRRSVEILEKFVENLESQPAAATVLSA